jgi:hypothetical protein
MREQNVFKHRMMFTIVHPPGVSALQLKFINFSFSRPLQISQPWLHHCPPKRFVAEQKQHMVELRQVIHSLEHPSPQFSLMLTGL